MKTQRGLGMRRQMMMPTIATPTATPSAIVGSGMRDASQIPMSQATAADLNLAQLVPAAQGAHNDVREYILGARSEAGAETGLVPTLRRHQTR
jgi:hypothetical protein